jgi:hypothetical protein
MLRGLSEDRQNHAVFKKDSPLLNRIKRVQTSPLSIDSIDQESIICSMEEVINEN